MDFYCSIDGNEGAGFIVEDRPVPEIGETVEYGGKRYRVRTVPPRDRRAAANRQVQVRLTSVNEPSPRRESPPFGRGRRRARRAKVGPVIGLEVAIDREPETTVLHLRGELDVATVAQLRAVALAELDRPACGRLVLDVSALAFVDSTGVGCWVELHSRAEENDKEVVVRSPTRAIARNLKIVGLTFMFQERPS